MPSSSHYIGRFAPTPSGHLHFGSLIAALASYADARAVGGRWLVRMEDLDKPREVPGAALSILHTLEHYGLEWDGAIEYQSQRLGAYRAVADALHQQGLAYYCTCSRKQLEHSPNHYPGYCRQAQHPAAQAALRLSVPEACYGFHDRLQGFFQQALAQEGGDFIIQRRDGIFAYQLAVVVDDGWQGITQIVRGADLLDSTPRQLYLQQLLGLPQPEYLHLPLIVQADGQKLSKSRQAPPLKAHQASALLWQALRILGQQPPTDLQSSPPKELVYWATQHWRPQAIPACATLPEVL